MRISSTWYQGRIALSAFSLGIVTMLPSLSLADNPIVQTSYTADPAPMEYEVSDREAVQIVNFVLATRHGSQEWEPVDYSLCSVFGSGMGGGEFGALVRRYADYLIKRGR